MALINAISALDGVEAEGDVKTGVKILRRALEEPLRGIAAQRRQGRRGRSSRWSAAAQSEQEHQHRLQRDRRRVRRHVEAGIIDPAKVTRSAVENAASIAGMILTTEALITDKPEEKAPAVRMPGGMGGMDY